MKYPFLALLTQSPRHGYELKQALELRFGPTLPVLNAGQVYTTLQRLERDSLIIGLDVEGDARGKRIYQVTEAGLADLRSWLQASTAPARLRDDFFIKLVLAGLSGIAEPRRLIEQHRRECLQSLRDLESALLRAPVAENAAANLLIEGAALHLEADLKWLDLCEIKLAKTGGSL